MKRKLALWLFNRSLVLDPLVINYVVVMTAKTLNEQVQAEQMMQQAEHALVARQAAAARAARDN